MRIQYLLNNVPVIPVNREGIFIEVNHDQQSVINQPRPHVGINNLYFSREDISYIMSLLDQSPGITEGIPFDIKILQAGNSHTIQMYIDCMAGLKRSDDGLSLTVKMRQSHDWLDDKIDSFTFESLYNETGVAPFTIDGVTYNSYQDFMDKKIVFVPYVISTIPNWHDAFLAIFSITWTVTEMYKIGQDIYGSISAIITDPFMWGEIARLLILVAIAAILIATLFSLISQLIACLIQPMKYHGAMLLRDLYKLTCVKLGLTGQSSIWDQYPFNQLVYIPEKYSPIEGSPSVFNVLTSSIDGFGTKGYTQPVHAPGTTHYSYTDGFQKGYFNGTGGDLFRLLKSFCNGKYVMPNATDTILLERRDYFPVNPTFQLPNLRQDWNGYNTDELSANIILKFISDLNERNCIEHISPYGEPFFPGTIFQATHSQVTTGNKQLVMLKGLREITIPVARGVAKDRLTFVEKMVQDLEPLWDAISVPIIVVLDAVILVINAFIVVMKIIIAIWNAILSALQIIIDAIDFLLPVSIDFDPTNASINDNINTVSFINPLQQFGNSNDFSNRLNALLVENDIMSTPKVVMIDTSRTDYLGSGRIGYLHPLNKSVVNCKYLWDKFYHIDAFTEDTNIPNATHSRETLISPSLNSDSEKNYFTLSLSDFLNLVSNPKFKDNWGEDVFADSVQWYIEQNGKADFNFRKKGWLKRPQALDAAERQQEIHINLQLKTSLPNGQ